MMISVKTERSSLEWGIPQIGGLEKKGKKGMYSLVDSWNWLHKWGHQKGGGAAQWLRDSCDDNYLCREVVV